MLAAFLQVYRERSEQKAERGDVENMQFSGKRCSREFEVSNKAAVHTADANQSKWQLLKKSVHGRKSSTQRTGAIEVRVRMCSLWGNPLQQDHLDSPDTGTKGCFGFGTRGPGWLLS